MVQTAGGQAQTEQRHQRGTPLAVAHALAQPERARHHDEEGLHMHHQRGHRHGRARHGLEEQGPAEHHEQPARDGQRGIAPAQPQFTPAAREREPQGEREQPEGAAEPHGGERGLARFFDEDAERSQQQATADHEPLALRFTLAAGGCESMGAGEGRGVLRIHGPMFPGSHEPVKRIICITIIR
ncbi:hypothetical protein FQZ97_925870 [compost metagenome]